MAQPGAEVGGAPVTARGRDRRGAGGGRSAAHAAPDEHTSFVLPGLLEFVKKPPKKTILDLGPALGENIRRMEGSKLFIANFFESLTEGGATP